MKAWLVAAIAVFVTGMADDGQRRSLGYAGSTPVGHSGSVAFSEIDCSAINRDPRRSHVRVPLSVDCAITLPAPDGRVRIVSEPVVRGDQLRLRIGCDVIVSKLEQPVTFLWSPRSDGFAINDGEGSGQVSRLRYFTRAASRWTESDRLYRSAAASFLKRYDCRANGAYVNVSAWDWTRTGMLRVIVQEGVHSRGCFQPYEDANVLLAIVGDPVTGRIVTVRQLRTLT